MRIPDSFSYLLIFSNNRGGINMKNYSFANQAEMLKKFPKQKPPSKYGIHLFLFVFVLLLMPLLFISDSPDSIRFYSLTDDDEEREATNALEALKQRKMMRAGDDGTIPFDALVRAKEHIDQMPVQDDAGLWNWEWLGPGNIGGRIRAILIHPDYPWEIWIGSVSGGIWKSDNGGSTWSPVNDFMANLAVTSLVMDATDHSVMYASTGEGFWNFDGLPGAGIFKSTDGGITWNQLPSTNNNNFRFVNRLAAHPTLHNRLYAVTKQQNNNSVWRTDDGGQTWTKILNTPDPATDIKINPMVPQRLIVGTQNDVYMSWDDGNNWSEQTTGAYGKLPNDPGRCEVVFSPANSLVIYVSMNRDQGGSNVKGEIWRSTDNGNTWSQRCTGYHYLGKQGWYGNAIWASPTNSNDIIVGGIDLWRSTDGGATLNRISQWQNYHTGQSAHADHHIIINHPWWNGDDNKTIYFGNDGGIQVAYDIDETGPLTGWTNLAGSTLGITQFYGGAAASDGSFIVGGTQDNDKLKYTPSSGAGNWYQAETGDGCYAAVDHDDVNYVYGEYPHLIMKESTNAGNSYMTFTVGLTDAGDGAKSLFISPFVMDPNNSETLIAGGASLWRINNATAWWSQWYEFRSDIGGYYYNGDFYYYKCSALDIAQGNSDIIWAGYNGGQLWQTHDGGGTWTRVDETTPLLPDRYVTDIAINPQNPEEVFVTFGGYENNSVWFTDNSGVTWQQRTGSAPNDLPAIQVNTVRFHPYNSNWVYIGTDLGIFASEDKGITWNKTPAHGDHDGPANVEVSELFWDGSYLIAATHGRGMYRCHPRDVIYVDKTSIWPGWGSYAFPYHTVTEAENAAGNGTEIRIFGNTYDENYLLLKKRGLIRSIEGTTVIK